MTLPRRSKPLVVAVQGQTKRVGHELFLAADVRVAASDTVFAQDEALLGYTPAVAPPCGWCARSVTATPCG
jgi:enoyl-CoA hydratase